MIAEGGQGNRGDGRDLTFEYTALSLLDDEV